MAINFLDPEATTVVNSILKRTTTSATRAADIETSKDVSGIEVRMLPPFIKDNHTRPIWPFPGYSKMYCLTIVVSDIENQLAGAIDLKGFPRIGDNEHLPINKTIFYWQQQKAREKSPNQIHIFCSILKSKQALRDTGKILSEVKKDEDYKGLIGTLGKVTKDITKFNIVTDIIMELAGVVGKHLGSVEDKPIGTVINSYTTLHGDFDNPGITPMLYNTPAVDFKFEVVVRNKVLDEQVRKAERDAQDGQPIKAARPARKPEEEEGEEEEVKVDMQAL